MGTMSWSRLKRAAGLAVSRAPGDPKADADPRPRALRIRHRLEYALFRTVLGTVGALPIDVATRIVAAVCREYSVRSRRHRRALANLERALPELSREEREKIAVAMWENVGRVIAEAAHFDTFLAEQDRYDPQHQRIMDEYTAAPGLIIVVSLHTGNWEIGMLRSAFRQHSPAAFYRVVVNPLVNDHLKRNRERVFTGGLFPVRDDSGGRTSVENTSRAMVACLRKGGPIGMIADHREPGGILVPFFGQEVCVSRVPATLALQFGGRLCVARTVRIGRQSRFWADGKIIDLPSTGNRQADIHAATAAIFREFESWIRQYPEQWLWSQAPFMTAAEAYQTPTD